MAGGVVTLIRKRRALVKDDVGDMSDLTDFFFDKPSNPRTRTPASKGWTTLVDEKLADHGSLLVEIKSTLAGVATDASAARVAAETEVEAQHHERQRVIKRDAAQDK